MRRKLEDSRMVSAGLSPRRVRSPALGWAWGEAGPVQAAIPPPREETAQEELRERWAATFLSSNQLPSLAQKPKCRQGRNYDTVIRQRRDKNYCMGTLEVTS